MTRPPSTPSGAGTRALYDAWSDTFVACSGGTHQTALLAEAPTPQANNVRLAELAGMAAGDRVIDLGCGVCGPALDWTKTLPGVQVVGVTFSPVQVRLAQQRITAKRDETGEEAESPRCQCVLGDYHKVPLPSASADVVMMLESACYSFDPPRLCAEIARLLRPGGRLLIKDMFLAGESEDAAIAAMDDPTSARQVLREMTDLWQLPPLHGAEAWCGWLRAAGLAEVVATPVAVDTGWFVGTMLKTTAQGIGLNRFGAHFFRPFAPVPVRWTVLTARR